MLPKEEGRTKFFFWWTSAVGGSTAASSRSDGVCAGGMGEAGGWGAASVPEIAGTGPGRILLLLLLLLLLLPAPALLTRLRHRIIPYGYMTIIMLQLFGKLHQ